MELDTLLKLDWSGLFISSNNSDPVFIPLFMLVIIAWYVLAIPLAYPLSKWQFDDTTLGHVALCWVASLGLFVLAVARSVYEAFCWVCWLEDEDRHAEADRSNAEDIAEDIREIKERLDKPLPVPLWRAAYEGYKVYQEWMESIDKDLKDEPSSKAAVCREQAEKLKPRTDHAELRRRVDALESAVYGDNITVGPPPETSVSVPSYGDEVVCVNAAASRMTLGGIYLVSSYARGGYFSLRGIGSDLYSASRFVRVHPVGSEVGRGSVIVLTRASLDHPPGTCLRVSCKHLDGIALVKSKGRCRVFPSSAYRVVDESTIPPGLTILGDEDGCDA